MNSFVIDDTKQSLSPVINSQSRVLILGTMPGDESLRQQRYYANPRNQFWSIISRVYRVAVPDDYDNRISLLLELGIALWDVLRSADRRGSLDSAIKNEAANDFANLFNAFPNVAAAGFNGRKAYDLYRKHVIGGQRVSKPLVTQILPSTSSTPGRYVLSFDDKVKRWSEFLLRDR